MVLRLHQHNIGYTADGFHYLYSNTPNNKKTSCCCVMQSLQQSSISISNVQLI